MRKVLIPLAASIAVLAVFLSARLLMSPEPSTTAVDDSTGSGVTGDPGTGLPENPGSATPVPEPTTPPRLTDPQGVPISSYHRYDEWRLAINYVIGVPACYGTVGEPKVVETARTVTVTLTRVPPAPAKGDVACIELALTKSVEVTLSAPLGDRVVLDGSLQGAPVTSAAPPSGGDSPAR